MLLLQMFEIEEIDSALNIFSEARRPLNICNLNQAQVFKPISTRIPSLQAIREKRKIISVGTTTTRALESSVDEKGEVIAQTKSTNIFIYPGYKFKVVDSLITNFHLPKSTLLMLVSAFYSREKMLEIYEEAVKMEYHFFSFGDAMFIK